MVLFLVHLASAIAINTYAIIVFEKIFSKTKLSFPVKFGMMAAASLIMTAANTVDINLLNLAVSFLVLFAMAAIFNKKLSLRVAFFVISSRSSVIVCSAGTCFFPVGIGLVHDILSLARI